MGWLRDAMRSARPPVRSFGQLARNALGSPGWPAEQKPKARSLAAILSRLDRGLDLDWLADRDAVQRVLAEQLSVPVSEVRAACDRRPSLDPTSQRVRFDDLPDARALDLRDEALPPGIPLLVQRPASWSRVWWYAPDGSGRSLVGQWLQARSLARYVAADTWATAEPETHERGAVYVELHGATLETTSAAFPTRKNICIAAPFEPSGSLEEDGWLVVRSPPVDTYLLDLLEWLAPRLPTDGRFELDTAARWLSGEPLQRGIIRDFGSVVSLVGAIDRYGIRELSAKPLRDVAQRWLRDQLGQAAREGSADAQWLRRQARGLLRGLARRCLTDAEEPLQRTRSEDAWIDLVPDEMSRSVDVEWMRVAFADSGNNLSSKELERAVRRVPPGSFRVVRALIHARLLRPAPGDQSFRLGPSWLCSEIEREALEELLDGSPFEWGEALFREHAAIQVARLTRASLANEDPSLIEAVLDLEAAESPAYAAAVELVVRAAGLALLAGQELPRELLDQLLELQGELLLSWSESLPMPRIRHTGAQDFALTDAAWYLALVALTEQSSPRLPSVLNPWRGDLSRERSHGLIDRLLDQLDTDRELGLAGTPTPQSVHGLISRLRAAQGPLSLRWDAHPLERVHAALDALEHDCLTPEVFRFADSPQFARTLFICADMRGLHWPSIAARLWSTWKRAGAPATKVLQPTANDQLWPHLPPELVPQALQCWGEAPFASFTQDQWRALLGAWRNLPPALRRTLNAFEHLPEALCVGALEVVSRDDERSIASLWNKSPQRCAAFYENRLRTLLDASETTAQTLAETLSRIAAAPTTEASRAIDAVRSALVARPGLPSHDVQPSNRAHLRLPRLELLAPIRFHLHEQVTRRGPAWRESYTLMDLIEGELTRSSG